MMKKLHACVESHTYSTIYAYNECMITRHERGNVVWVDIESPTRQELHEVMREFDIDGRIEEEIASSTPYPILVSSPKYHYAILHFPASDPTGGAKSQEIDFIVGKKFLITARYEAIHSIHNLHKVFEAEELLGISKTKSSGDVLLERILRRLYGAIREEVEIIGRQLDRIEHDIFGGKERETMRTISEVNRVLLRFDMMIKRHEENLSSLLQELSAPTFFGKSFADSAAHIEAEREHVASLISSYREIAAELRDTNDSLLSASQNEVMKTLTVITFIILPLTLIASVFQMRVPGLPLTNDPNAFWIIIGLDVVVTGLLVLYTKLRHWL
jgi:magnesium transporter